MNKLILAAVSVAFLAGCVKKEEDLVMIKSAANKIMQECEVNPRIELITTNHETRVVVACDSFPRTAPLPK